MIGKSDERIFLEEITGGSLVWDNHSCMPLRRHESSYMPLLERCKHAGVDLITLPIGYADDSIEQHFAMLSTFRDWIAKNPNIARLVYSINEARKAKEDGVLGVCFDIEGMRAVGDQPNLVRTYYDLGVKWMLIAYNYRNAAGGGCMEEDGGLTDFGREVISHMNEVGMVLCCTHAGDRTARDAIAASKQPIIFSHSNSRAVYEHARNIPDDLLVACAEKGGVIGLNGIGIFLGRNDASLETFARHYEYVVNLVGEDHIGLGLDYCFDQDEIAQALESRPDLFPPESFPRDIGMTMIPPWEIANIARHLRSRGHSLQRISKFLGGNLMRIAEEVWR